MLGALLRSSLFSLINYLADILLESSVARMEQGTGVGDVAPNRKGTLGSIGPYTNGPRMIYTLLSPAALLPVYVAVAVVELARVGRANDYLNVKVRFNVS